VTLHLLVHGVPCAAAKHVCTATIARHASTETTMRGARGRMGAGPAVHITGELRCPCSETVLQQRAPAVDAQTTGRM
jgi:hypothetical protein